jgi:hypothetical protein
MTQRFAQFIMMQAQQVMLVLGVTPSPYGQMPPQLPEAKMLIDQLEMIKIKMAGNLTAQESALVTKMIEQCSMAFTKVSGGTPPSLMAAPSMREIPLDEIVGPMDDEAPATAAPALRNASPAPDAATQPNQAKPAPEESKKKYVKSYGSF